VKVVSSKPGINAAAMDTFEIERALDLPGPLPQGEHIVWMDSPEWKSFAIRVFHLKGLAVYFAAILAAHALWQTVEGGSAANALASTARLLPLALAALGGFALMGWLMAKSTVYAFTNRRVLMRIGVALSITVELPFRMIQSADIGIHKDGTGDLPLRTVGQDHIALIHLWPHALPWSIRKTVPMMRAVPDAERVAALFGQTLRAELGASQTVAAASTAPGDFGMLPAGA
jgi:Bacterial PH domain